MFPFRHWLRAANLFPSRRPATASSRRSAQRRSERPNLETLDERTLPATLNFATGQLLVQNLDTYTQTHVTIQHVPFNLVVDEVHYHLFNTNQGFVFQNETVGVFPDFFVTSLRIQTGPQDDVITLKDLPTSLAVTVDGGDRSNTLEVAGASNTWHITAANGGDVNGNIQFANFPTLRALSGDNRFVVRDGGTFFGIDGGNGLNSTLDYSACTRPVCVNVLDNWDLSGTAGVMHIQSIRGGSGSDDIWGGGTWHITETNGGDVGGVHFSSFENLHAKYGGNHFVFGNGTHITGNVVGSADVPPKIDFFNTYLGYNIMWDTTTTLDFSADTGGLTVNVSDRTASPIGGVFDAITDIVGGSGNNAMMGWGYWSITDTNAGTVNFYRFVGFQNLFGRGLSDWFHFSDGKGVTGILSAGPGMHDALDFSAYTTPVTVDLSRGTASPVGGGLSSGFAIVFGGSGDDNLTASPAGSVLVGGGGNVILVGSSGRDILIGGAGADQLYAGSAGAILIDGTTAYDSNAYALQALLAEWQRTDISYLQRIADLRGGLGLTNGNKLTSTTVTSDNSVDKLYGGPGQDWFWATNGFALTLPGQPPAKPQDSLFNVFTGWLLNPTMPPEQVN
jgi:hypothetical protein